jgi:hypothetical protein
LGAGTTLPKQPAQLAKTQQGSSTGAQKVSPRIGEAANDALRPGLKPEPILDWNPQQLGYDCEGEGQCVSTNQIEIA